MTRHLLFVLVLLASACDRDGKASYDMPYALREKEFSAQERVTLDFVMNECASACAVVEHRACDVVVDDSLIKVDVAIEVEERGGACIALCAKLLVSCDVGYLAPGEYRIEAGGFEDRVTVD